MKAGLPTIAERLDALAAGDTSAATLLDEAFARATGPEAHAVYTQLFERAARAEAEAADTRRVAGVPGGLLAGIPIAVKDLFDVAGAVTRAGSRLLADQPPASSDAETVHRLRAAGAVITGHVNMTEFAYSGVGLNPHYGTPPNPLAGDRIPGGSSSGSAVAVARGMAVAALGTDTGGSVRIPAAFCGLVGFKPTLERVTRAGAFPLSPTLDSVGPIAASVACCATLDSVLTGETPAPLSAAPVRGLRLAVPTRYVLDNMDGTVSGAFERALHALREGGAQVTEAPFELLERLPELGKGGGFPAAESYHIHRRWLEDRSEEYDPRVRVRIERGASMSAHDYLDLHRVRAELMASFDELMTDWNALVMPTVPIVPPRFEELENDDDYMRLNALVLRNPTAINMLGLCAITLPCHRSDELPVGLMLVGRAGADRSLLRIAAGIESMNLSR